MQYQSVAHLTRNAAVVSVYAACIHLRSAERTGTRAEDGVMRVKV